MEQKKTVSREIYVYKWKNIQMWQKFSNETILKSYSLEKKNFMKEKITWHDVNKDYVLTEMANFIVDANFGLSPPILIAEAYFQNVCSENIMNRRKQVLQAHTGWIAKKLQIGDIIQVLVGGNGYFFLLVAPLSQDKDQNSLPFFGLVELEFDDMADVD